MIENQNIEFRHIKLFSDLFISCGVPVKSLESVLGFSLKMPEKANKRFSTDVLYKLLSAGFELTEPGTSLKIAQYLEGGYSGIVYHLIYHCRNLEDAIYLLVRYWKLYFTIISWQLHKEDNFLKLTCCFKNPADYKRYYIEMAFSSFVIRTRNLTGVDYSPVEIRFRYDKPNYYQIYKEVFHTVLRFNQEEDSILFDQSVLKLKNPRQQPYIKNILLDRADKLLSEMEGSERYTNKVQQIILEYLPTGSVDIDMICGRLNMSRWTLNRKLNQESTTFKEVCVNIKKHLAVNYLKTQNVSISEVAYLLGYSEVSPFNRAFKAWTGKSPNQYRSDLSAKTKRK
jgi:AraC-like DNA-binding protein